MEDWSLDVINEYCQEHFGGDVVCEMAEGKGRIMIARKNVKQGELLFAEPPLHIVQEDEDNEAFELLKNLCEEGGDDFDYEPLWYWTALSSLTAEQIKDGPTVGKLKPVTKEQQRRLLSLYHEPVEGASDAVEKIVNKLGLTVAAVVVEELLQAWILNCFEHSEDPLGYSAYFASSFVSHSCGPNAVWTEGDEGVHELRARQDISEGDEISISYLEEHVLLHSSHARKMILKETKLFDCACERCAPSPSDKDGRGTDVCRGFICPECGKCGVFHPLKLVSEATGKKGSKGKPKGKGKGEALIGMTCVECGEIMDFEKSDRLLDAERILGKKLDELDKKLEKSRIDKVMTEAQAQTLLKLLGDSESGVVGPQHWFCDRVWERLQSWYESEDRREESRRMQELRVEYHRKAYDGLSGALAWTLEAKGDMLLRHLGFGLPKKASDAQFEEEMAAQVEPTLEESRRILGLMFGFEHENCTTVDRKLEVAKKFLKTRAKK
eukprot:TRINITY_DN24352_c0_g7_i1.p1 TRINITY_DN24352_c0_g7~~TRINITY_DN24352_c0_g7_i1.p1  ORF type:complete len:495 (-),score=84.47 TRINITY_DN24352_c0_g7_i1:262-1746(-)